MEFPLFETLAIVDGQVQNITYHQYRYQNSLSKFYPNQITQIIDFATLIPLALASFLQHTAITGLPTLLRCRVDYNATHYQVGFFPYIKKSYHYFTPVVCDEINYPLKFANRHIFTKLLAQKGIADEVMIIKQGFVTDCTIGNLIFKQRGEWFTPSTPLLQGTQRAKLLAEQKVSVREIRLQSLDKFEEVRLINALNGLEML